MKTWRHAGGLGVEFRTGVTAKRSSDLPSDPPAYTLTNRRQARAHKENYTLRRLMQVPGRWIRSN